MSDRNSDSSCEWVLLNNDDGELDLEENETFPLNVDINCDSVCLAASTSINSSISSEELEWEYDRLGNSDLSQNVGSHIEEVEIDKSLEDCNGEPNAEEIEDISMDSCGFNKDFAENIDINIASVQKAQCYKHDRNDNLNFILNIMLALVVSSAIGLGTGHFLGWSHKCWRNLPELKDTIPNSVTPAEAIITQNLETLVSKEKEIMTSVSFENQLETLELSLKTGSDSVYQTICEEKSSNNFIPDIAPVTNSVTEISSLSNADISGILISKEVRQTNFSDSEYSTGQNILPEIDWNKISQVIVPDKSISPKNMISVKINNEHLIPIKSVSSYLSNFKESVVNDIDNDSNFKDEALYESYLSKQQDKDDANRENNFISQLREDLYQVVQTLNTIILSQLSNDNAKYILGEELNKVQNLFKDLQNTIDLKISFINEFVQSKEYKTYPKLGLKHMQKMVYNLLDSFDRVMKMSLKAINKSTKINAFKFSKNLSNIIFNFDRKWEKNQRNWSENLEKTKSQELKQKFFQESKNKWYKKEAKHWKRKDMHERDFKDYKNKRYSMNS